RLVSAGRGGTEAKARQGPPVPRFSFRGAKQNHAPRFGSRSRLVNASTYATPWLRPSTCTGPPSWLDPIDGESVPTHFTPRSMSNCIHSTPGAGQPSEDLTMSGL